MSFPQNLADLRKKRGFTQQVMADMLGIHVSQLKRYEKGTSQPTLEVFRKIVLALNVSADMLLFDNERGPEEDLRFHFEAISKLPSQEKNVIKELIEGMLLKHDAKRWTQASAQ
jgi:transcriptional regulator with XRE-family HTH domain